MAILSTMCSDRLCTYDMALARLMIELERTGVGRPTRSPLIKFWYSTSRKNLFGVPCGEMH